MEISQESINKSSVDVKTKLADDLMRLLNVREKNSDMAKDWLLFMSTSNFKITAGEIYLAFQMALSRQLFDETGKEFDLFPELSNNSTGKVVSAYLKYKKESLMYQNAKEKLKALKTPEIMIDKNQIRNEFLKTIYNDMKENGFCDSAHLLYDDLINIGKINPSNDYKKELYARELVIYIPAEKENLRIRNPVGFGLLIKKFQLQIDEKQPIIYVQNRCKSFIVCEYLSGFLFDFETFKNEL